MTREPVTYSDDSHAIFMGGENGADGVIVRGTNVVATVRRGNLEAISLFEGISQTEAAERYNEVNLSSSLTVCMDKNCKQTPIPMFIEGIRNGWGEQSGGAEFIKALQ